jgi:hypothetical protein
MGRLPTALTVNNTILQMKIKKYDVKKLARHLMGNTTKDDGYF